MERKCMAEQRDPRYGQSWPGNLPHRRAVRSILLIMSRECRTANRLGKPSFPARLGCIRATEWCHCAESGGTVYSAPPL